MTTATAPRPSIAPRPAGAPAGGGGAASGPIALDPVKLLKQYKIWLLAAAVVGAGLGVAAYLVLRQVSPQYTARVQYVVAPADKSALESNTPAGKEQLDRLMRTQEVVITSDQVLRDAVAGPQVQTTQWAQAYSQGGQINVGLAARELQEIAAGRARSGTDVLELTVTTANPNDAAVLAQEIHAAYFRFVGRISGAETSERRNQLSLQKNQLLSRLTENEATIAQLLQRNNIDTRSIGETQASQVIQNAEPRRVELGAVIQQFQREKDDLEARDRAEGGRQFTKQQEEQAERDPEIIGLRNQLNALRAEVDSMMQQGMGMQNGQVRSINARRDSTLALLEVRRRDVLDKLFNADLDRANVALVTAERELVELSKQVEKAKEENAQITRTNNRVSELQEINSADRASLAEIEHKLRDSASLASQTAEVMNGIRRIDGPRTPDSLSFPKLRTMLPLGVFLTLSLTAGLIVLRELLDQRVRGPADIAMLPRVKLLGIIPMGSEDPTKPTAAETAFRDTPTGAVSEAYRQVRAQLLKKMHQSGHRSLLVMAGQPESGATSTVVNLAMGWAASDYKVLVVDGNFRRPALHRILKLGEGPGLGDLLARKITLDAAVQQTATPNLHLLAAGSTASRTVPERLATEAMTQALKEAGEKYDLVIVDTAPALVAGDGLALANRCDAVLLVVKAYGEKRGLVARIRDQLGEVRGEFMGVLVNGVRSSAGGYLRQNIRVAHEYQTVTNA